MYSNMLLLRLDQNIFRSTRLFFLYEEFALRINVEDYLKLKPLCSARSLTIFRLPYSTRPNKLGKSHLSSDKVSYSLAEHLYKKHFDSHSVFPLVNDRNKFDTKSHLDSSFEDLITKIRCLPKGQRSTYFMKQMEKEALEHMTSVDLSQLLTILECFLFQKHRAYELYSSILTYVNGIFENLKFSKDCLVRLMFQIFIFGEAPEEFCDKLEESIFTIVEELTISEISVICLGFFRCNKQIKSYDLQDHFSQKLLQNIKTTPTEDLSNILKVFRHSNFKKFSFYEELGNKIINIIQNGEWKVNLHTLMHISYVYASTKFYHKPMMEMILNESLGVLRQCHPDQTHFYRGKDVALLVWALGTFRISISDDQYKVFLNCFENVLRGTDLKKYSQSVVDFNIGSIYLGVFPKKFLKIMFSPELLHIYKGGKHKLDEKIFQLLLSHNSIRLECANFPHKTLSKEYLLSILDHPNAFGYLNKELIHRLGLQTLYLDLKEIIGEGKVHCHFILPHFKSADIEIHCDEDGIPLRFDPMPAITFQGYDSEQSETLEHKKLVSNEDKMKDDRIYARKVRKIAISVVGKNQCAVNCDLILGHHQTKLRQLKKLGYDVIVIMPSLAEEYSFKETTKRKEYIQKEILSRFKK